MKKSAAFIKLCKKYEVDPDLVPEIKSFEEACKATSNDPTNLPIVGRLPQRHQKRLLADYKLSIIGDALREGKDANYTDGSTKYFAYFLVKANKKKPSGFGLSCGGYDSWASTSSVGVRLCFANRDTAVFFGKHFIDLHTDHHLLT